MYRIFSNKKRAAVIACLLIAALLAGAFPAAHAYADEPEDLEELEQQIEQAKQEKQQASNKRQSAQEKLDSLKDEQSAVIEEKMALEERNIAAAEEIELIGREISLYKKKIDQKEKDVERALNRENEQLLKYRTRVRAMEESEGYNIIDIILNSDNLMQLLSAIDDYKDIMNSDVVLYQQLQEARSEHEAIKAEYEEIKKDCEEKQAELEKQKKQLEDDIAAAEERIAELDEEIQKAEEEIAALERAEAAASAAASSFMSQYLAAKAAAQQAANQAQVQPYTGNETQPEAGGTQAETPAEQPQQQPEQPQQTQEQPQSQPQQQQPEQQYVFGEVTGTGGFMWPFPGHYIITSPFGYRASTGTYHTGVDIDGYQSMGSAIVASDGGTVIMAQYYGGYGNCIIIDHNNGYSTLYAHLSSMSVGVGSVVSQGQTIGGVGNTGTCYGLDGVHLHFEVMVGGSQTDPLGYLPGVYTFYT